MAADLHQSDGTSSRSIKDMLLLRAYGYVVSPPIRGFLLCQTQRSARTHTTERRDYLHWFSIVARFDVWIMFATSIFEVGWLYVCQRTPHIKAWRWVYQWTSIMWVIMDQRYRFVKTCARPTARPFGRWRVLNNRSNTSYGLLPAVEVDVVKVDVFRR